MSSIALKWQCSEGHEWEAKPSDIKSGTWCPYCAGKYKTIEDMRKLAKKRNGKCLSNLYLGANKHLILECSEGHEWRAKPSNIKSGKWCPYCAGRHQTISDMKKIAMEYGGDCISESYVDAKTKLTWRCMFGHEWDALPNSYLFS